MSPHTSTPPRRTDPASRTTPRRSAEAQCPPLAASEANSLNGASRSIVSQHQVRQAVQARRSPNLHRCSPDRTPPQHWHGQPPQPHRSWGAEPGHRQPRTATTAPEPHRQGPPAVRSGAPACPGPVAPARAGHTWAGQRGTGPTSIPGRERPRPTATPRPRCCGRCGSLSSRCRSRPWSRHRHSRSGRARCAAAPAPGPSSAGRTPRASPATASAPLPARAAHPAVRAAANRRARGEPSRPINKGQTAEGVARPQLGGAERARANPLHKHWRHEPIRGQGGRDWRQQGKVAETGTGGERRPGRPMSAAERGARRGGRQLLKGQRPRWDGEGCGVESVLRGISDGEGA